jgi:surfeit locus 1 family protein
VEQPVTKARSALVAWLVCALGVGIAVRLGFWQLDRAAQKSAVLTEQRERAGLPPLAPDALARTDAEAAAQWYRQISVRGRWLADKTLYLDNQPLDGRAGFIAVTPLLLSPGDAVLVQRGWTARDPADRTRLPAIETPEGELMLNARIAPWPSRRFDLGPEEAGRIRQNLDADALAFEWGAKLRPLSLLELEQAPVAGARWVRRWSTPAPDVGKHHGYALQWFAIAALIAGLTMWYRILRPRREDRR